MTILSILYKNKLFTIAYKIVNKFNNKNNYDNIKILAKNKELAKIKLKNLAKFKFKNISKFKSVRAIKLNFLIFSTQNIFNYLK